MDSSLPPIFKPKAEKGPPKGEETKSLIVPSEVKKEIESEAAQDSISEGSDSESMLRQLKYGDKIKLYWEKASEKYYISTDGIATSRLFFRYHQPSAKEKDTFKEKDVFIIVPSSESRVLARLKTDIKASNKKMKETGKVEEMDILTKEEGYQQDIPQEIMTNWQYHKSMLGKPVCYNTVIQLVHEKTQQYVRISKKVDLSPAQTTENKAGSGPSKTDFMRVYSLKLDTCSGPETQFMLSPCFKYQENDQVLAQDSFCLAYKDTQLLNKQFFLHFQPNIQGESKAILNFYLTEEEKSPIRFELHENSQLEGHLFGKLHEKAIWITHIQAPVYLSLKRIEKATDQDENELGDLIEPVDEALSQAFSLSFKPYDPGKPMSSDGLWVGYASSRKNEVILRHIQYEVWLKPLQLEQLVRADNEEGAISEGSLFKLKVRETGMQVQLRERIYKKPGSSPATSSKGVYDTMRDRLRKNTLARDDYYKSFKVVVANEQQQSVLLTISDLARYIRTFDMETAKRYGDYTGDALLRILSKALKRLKLLCINGLPATIQQSYPYKQPIDTMQRLMREMGCIDAVAGLLLKLFPGGASVDYSENEFMRKLLGQLLTLISISVKNNKENKMYTFQKTMRTIQKYIGLHLPKAQEDKALLSVVENCEEILLDSSLEHIINQFVREIANNSFKEKMKKNEILKILRIFCVNENKGISGTQDLLYNILFETEVGNKVLLYFTFRSIEDDQLILKVEGDEEVNCCEDWTDSEERKNILLYFKNELYLFADMIHQNKRTLNTIKELFPVQALIKNLQCPTLNIVAKTGLTRMLISLFMNTENLLLVKKPKTQRVLGDDQVAGLRSPTYIATAQLDQIKRMINTYFSENNGGEDLSLHYEYLRLLSYLLNSDFLLGPVETKEEWRTQLSEAYELLEKAFMFCVNQLYMIGDSKEMSYRKRTTTGNLAQVHDESEDVPVISTAKGVITEEQLAEAPRYAKFPMQYIFMFQSFSSGEKKKDLYQSYAKDIKILIQEEICNFMTQLMYFMHDGYITAFTSLIYRVRDLDSQEMLIMTKRFMLEVFNSGKENGGGLELLYETQDALEYKDIKHLYTHTRSGYNSSDTADGLYRLLTRQFIAAKDERLENLILEVLIGSQFKLSEYGRFLENLFFIRNDKCKTKQIELGTIIQQLYDLINHSTNSLNVSDIKNLKQVSITLAMFKDSLSSLYDLFILTPEEAETGTLKHKDIMLAKETELDPVFTKLFIKTKGYLTIIEFLRLCSSVKLEAARNVLEGNENLGLHAVTVSKELLQVIQLCNYILINFCKSSTKAKIRLLKHIPRITLIPPPKDKDCNAKWELFTELTASDVQLINEICKGNNQIAYLNNQQVGYFKELVALLNQSICPLNIGKIFEVFENIMDQTTHDGLYKDILGYFWDNKRHIVIESIKGYTAETSPEVFERMAELVKVAKLLAQSSELKIAKLKLRDIFSIELFSECYGLMCKLYQVVKNSDLLGLMQNFVQVYGEIYLCDKIGSEDIASEFEAVFDISETLMRDKEDVNEIGEEEIKLLDIVYALQKRYSNWRLNQALNVTSRSPRGSFKEAILHTVGSFRKNVPETDRRLIAMKSILGAEDETPQNRRQNALKDLIFSKARNFQTNMGKEQFKKIKGLTLADKELSKYIAEEFNEFSVKLLGFIEKAGNLNASTALELQEKERSRQYIGKLIEYIGNCGKRYGKTGTIKYLLMSFIGVLDMAGEDQVTPKGKHKAKKKILLTLDSLKLTKTLLTLLCSDESESLDAILPALLKLANKMLDSSIREIQDQFYKEFESNRKSEKLFERMCTAINRNVFIYRWHPQMFAMQKSGKIFQTIAEIDIQKEILIFIKSLCENGHEALQGFMLEQKLYKNPYNMIHLLVRYLETLVKEIKVINDREPDEISTQEAARIPKRKSLCYSHSILAIRALCECIQGPCKKNQEAVGDSDFLVIANEILTLNFIFGRKFKAKRDCYFSNYQLCKIKNECALLMLSLLEQRGIDDQLVIKMRQCIKESTLLDNLRYVYYAFMLEKNCNYSEVLLFKSIENSTEDCTDSFVLSLGFTLLFILKKWFELSPTYGSPTKEIISKITTKVTSLQSDEYGFFGDLLNFSVDLVVGFVLFFTKAVTNVVLDEKQFIELKQDRHFNKRALKFFQTFSGTIEIVRNNKSEIVHFPILPYAEALTEQQQTETFSGMPIGQAKAKLDYFMGGCMNTLQTMKNEYLFAKTFRHYPVFGAVAKHLRLWNTLAFYMAILINGIMLFSYKKVETGFSDRLDNPSLFGAMGVSETKRLIFILGVFLCSFASIQVMAFLFKYIPSVYNKTKLQFDEEAEKQTSSIEMVKLRAEFLIKFIWAVFANPQLYYNVAYLLLGLLGVLLHPLFFTYHLLTVIFRYQKLIDVLQAFWGPITEIILTLLFFLIIEYIFTVLGYIYFAEMYPDYTCYSLLSCFIITLDQTFKNDGGFGAFLTQTYKPEEGKEKVTYHMGRLMFDQLSNFILLILIVQILAGLIIDKFGEIREDSENMEEELKSNCVICGEKGDVIERKTGETFEQHKEVVHNLWNYILFIGYLKRKPKQELNGIESWVYNLFKKENIGWLPYSLWEGKDEGVEKEKINVKLKEIQDVLKSDIKENT